MRLLIIILNLLSIIAGLITSIIGSNILAVGGWLIALIWMSNYYLENKSQTERGNNEKN